MLLVDPVFARPRQQPECRIAALEVDIDLHRKQPRRDVLGLLRERGVKLDCRRAEIPRFAHCRSFRNELLDRLATAGRPEQ